MRTIIDIPQTILVPLDQLAEDEGVSRAEIVREMLADGVKQRKRKKVTLEDAFGIFKHDSPFGDGLEYQLKIRSEWDDRDRAIEEWRERQKKHSISLSALRKLSKKTKKIEKQKKPK